VAVLLAEQKTVEPDDELLRFVPGEHVIRLDADFRNAIAERRLCSGPATVERCVAVTTVGGMRRSW
jgi:hypothetical protein